MSGDTPRQSYIKRLGALKNERAQWDAHWRDLNDYLMPRRSRFNVTERNQGKKLNTHIINSSPLIAVRTLAAGMMAGLTSPARPWFRLTTPDPELARFEAVREWLHKVEERIRWAFLKSNLYNVLPGIYQDLGIFGTAACVIDRDDEDTIRGYVLPTGTYCLATSARQAVSTLYQETSRTYGQLVDEFGIDKVSGNIRRQVKERGNVDQWAEICHVIEPNVGYLAGRLGPKGMPFRSVWFEKAKGAEEGFLREGGYKTNPLIAVRWDILDGDVYGRGPGMDALGDAKALQHLEKKKLTQVDKLADPPMRAPTTLRTQRTSLLPGDVTYVDQMAGGATFEPAQVINPQGITATGEEIRNHSQRIDSVFYADLWLMLQRSDARMTATEVAERHEEKLLQLGPVLERLQDELLDPLIDRVFSVLLEEMILPPPPPELAGVDLRVDYISILADAQKLLGLRSIERFIATAGQLATIGKTEALDKINTDKVMDEIGSSLGLKPDLVNSEEEVTSIRDARAKAAQAQAAAEQAGMAAQAGKTLSETDTTGENGLTAMLRSMGAPAQGLA